MSFIPIEIKCTYKAPDGKPMYPQLRVIWQGRVHTWYNATDRTAFYNLVRSHLKLVTGKDWSTVATTWVIADRREYEGLLKEYGADDELLADILAELKKRIGEGEEVPVARKALTDDDVDDKDDAPA